MRLGGSEGQVSVDVVVGSANSSIDRRAVLDSDFSQPLVSTLVWQDGDRTKKSIYVPIIDDDIAEQTKGSLSVWRTLLGAQWYLKKHLQMSTL